MDLSKEEQNYFCRELFAKLENTFNLDVTNLKTADDKIKKLEQRKRKLEAELITLKNLYDTIKATNLTFKNNRGRGYANSYRH
ncbi:hypothetical protein KQX54_001907 [Cotesia glomerata]|uniref:Uncharacterized protein n=1 Tax=Cotesia glomerata TaxID=32391 RepID=A0AAV7IAE2_COTGL|nr:hypothetical protein KQX54_001907 [Cotesia glomerata]